MSGPVEHRDELGDAGFRDARPVFLTPVRESAGTAPCAINLPRLTDRPEARQLMRSLYYAASADFHQAASLDPSLVVRLLGPGN
jgi:hypothetical protein